MSIDVMQRDLVEVEDRAQGSRSVMPYTAAKGPRSTRREGITPCTSQRSWLSIVETAADPGQIVAWRCTTDPQREQGQASLQPIVQVLGQPAALLETGSTSGYESRVVPPGWPAAARSAAAVQGDRRDLASRADRLGTAIRPSRKRSPRPSGHPARPGRHGGPSRLPGARRPDRPHRRTPARRARSASGRVPRCGTRRHGGRASAHPVRRARRRAGRPHWCVRSP